MFEPLDQKEPALQRAIRARKLWFRIAAPVHRILARRARGRIGRLIGITGSVGKTTAALMLGEILKRHGTAQTGLACNTEYHVYRGIRHVKAPIDYRVQEVSGHMPGHIGRVTATIPFDGAVITRIGRDHWSTYKSLEGIAEEKGTLAASIAPEGFACLNADDPLVAGVASRCRARVITFGTSEGATLRATNIRAAWPGRLSFTLTVDGEGHEVQTRMVGSIYLPSILGAIAGAYGLGIPLADIAADIADISAAPRRMEVVEAGGHTFILDTIKASYWSTEILFNQIEELAIPDLVVVLGEVSDIANDSSRQVRKLIRRLAPRVGIVAGVGPVGRSAFKVGAEGVSNVLSFNRREDVADFLRGRPPSIVLLKGNTGFDLNRIVTLLEQPSHAQG